MDEQSLLLSRTRSSSLVLPFWGLLGLYCITHESGTCYHQDSVPPDASDRPDHGTSPSPPGINFTVSLRGNMTTRLAIRVITHLKQPVLWDQLLFFPPTAPPHFREANVYVNTTSFLYRYDTLWHNHAVCLAHRLSDLLNQREFGHFQLGRLFLFGRFGVLLFLKN